MSYKNDTALVMLLPQMLAAERIQKGAVMEKKKKTIFDLSWVEAMIAAPLVGIIIALLTLPTLFLAKLVFAW